METGIVKNIIYFEQVGKHNTEETFKIVKIRADELKINTILVASTYGETGVKAVKFFKGYKVVVVSHVCGSREPNVQEMKTENIEEIRANGGILLTTGHAFAGIDRAIRNKLNTYEVSEIVAYTLRIFCQGIKVSAEIAMMAADAGLVRTDEEIIVIAGTSEGADTAVVLKPENSHRFFDMVIKEIICKPRL